MVKELSEFNEDECLLVYDSIINNENHIDKKKTKKFLERLKNIKNDKTTLVLKYAELYYLSVKSFFNLDKDEKMFYMSNSVQDFKNSNLTCCLQVLDYENISCILDHSLSIEHFIEKNGLDNKIHKEIKIVSDYFFATGIVNLNELSLIIELIQKNKNFKNLIELNIKKL